jgi:hypothetical protein
LLQHDIATCITTITTSLRIHRREFVCVCRLEMLIIIPGACIGLSPNCVGINMGGFPGWAQLSLVMFPSRTVHNLFTPSCVGWGTGNFGPQKQGEPISDEFSRDVWLP